MECASGMLIVGVMVLGTMVDRSRCRIPEMYPSYICLHDVVLILLSR